MPWNWEQPDWPRFTWDADRLAKAESRFLLNAGIFLGAVKHLSEDDHSRLVVEAIGDEAVTTSAIEGEILDRESVQSSIRRALGLATDKRRVGRAEQGVAEMMVDLYHAVSKGASESALTNATLFRWHRMLLEGDPDVEEVGRYRTHHEPMQVLSGRIDKPKVHFEAPPSSRVPEEMGRFLDWFNDTRPGAGNANALPALTRAGVAHLYFESIHPFEDGNGRIGRAIAEMALAQSLGRPTLTALAATILARRAAYYDALERANKRNEITEWLAWFAGITLEAQGRTQAIIEFLIEKTRLLESLRGQLNARQEKVLLRVLREGPAGFQGGLSASNYIAIARTSPATATRDLQQLAEIGALERVGERKHTRYHLPIPMKPPTQVIIDDQGEVILKAPKT